uniref:Uncharacterized protein n=1 Tax=Manihot esculenta TaxID=3983 RepID=A0A2C9WDA2_MANES
MMMAILPYFFVISSVIDYQPGLFFSKVSRISQKSKLRIDL